ncbi:MAG: hypothetical protein IJY88_00510 [Clostridia bacterium]|nr:hypothetical protein [Clostridia bacterium]
MSFSDIHTHILYGADDGAKTREDAFAIVKASYESGTRLICATPHFHPGYFGDNREQILHSFEVLCEHCSKNYPDLKLFLGNELFYTYDSVSWVKNKLCLPMGSTEYMLVEFSVHSSDDEIAEGVDRLLNIGYIPIIAHAERYGRLKCGRLAALRENGVLVQMNTEAVNGKRLGLGYNKRVKTLLTEGLVDFISSDAHDLTRRPPQMDKSFKILAEKYGHGYAERLCRTNAEKLFCREMTAEDI